MDEDSGQSRYAEAATSTTPVKSLINAIAGTTLTPYSGYSGITITYDSEDSLIDTFAPADYFSVHINETRRDKILELLEYTGCKIRAESAGVHVLVPTVAGTVYNYEYKFNVSGEHNFFAKTVRNRFVNPNKEVVTTDPSIAGTSYTGNSTSATSFGLDPKIHTTYRRLASNAQATAIAAAIITKRELDAERGFVTVPMNVGQEIWDYVKVTDSRTGDTRTGNVQFIQRNVAIHFNKQPLTFSMQIAFGRTSLESLMVNTQASRMDASSGDSSGSFKAINEIVDYLEQQKLGQKWVVEEDIENLDDVKDGTTYKRILATAITAGNIKLSEVVGTLDDVDDGVTNGKVLLTNLSAGNIKLTSAAVADGKWYNYSGVSINASTGINIYGTNNALTLRAAETSAIQVYAGSDGALYAGGGAVKMSASGLQIIGDDVPLYFFRTGGTALVGLMWADDVTTNFVISASAGYDLYLKTASTANTINIESHIKPSASAIYDIGNSSYPWRNISSNTIFINNEGKISLRDAGTYNALNITNTAGHVEIEPATNRDLDLYSWGTGDISLTSERDLSINGVRNVSLDAGTSLTIGGNVKATVYCNGLTACPIPALPEKSALDLIRSLKPIKEMDGHFGHRNYFDEIDLPNEFKKSFPQYNRVEVADKKRNGKPVYKNELVGYKDEVEIISTVGILLQSVKELTEEVDKLKNH
jgi:hypothetical protein